MVKLECDAHVPFDFCKTCLFYNPVLHRNGNSFKVVCKNSALCTMIAVKVEAIEDKGGDIFETENESEEL